MTPTITKDLQVKLPLFNRINELLRSKQEFDTFEYDLTIGVLSIEPKNLSYLKPRRIKISKGMTNRLTGLSMPPSIEMEIYISSSHLMEADDIRFIHIIINAIKIEIDHAIQNNENPLIVEGMEKGRRVMEQVMKTLGI